MMNEAMTPRQQRGLMLATTRKISRNHGAFVVPSQTDARSYMVVHVAGVFHCTCPDYELHGETCKHGFAVQFFLKRETAPDGTVSELRGVRVTYPQQWAAYNAAQTTEKETFCRLLRDLVADLPAPEPKRGRPAIPMSDGVFSAAYKVYSTVSARRFMTDLRDAHTKGFISRVPHYNSIFNVLDKPELTPVLKSLITRSAMPLRALETTFAVDSTGFGTQNFYRHFTAKWGRETVKRDYLKIHAMIGTVTNVITDAEATDRDRNDAPMFRGLVENTMQHFDVRQVAADKAYNNRHTLEFLDANGITSRIPFRVNANPDRKDSDVWAKLYYFFQLHKEEFLATYHSRSNAESTFSAIKRKFGDTIRSKTPTAQRNEALLKVLCHNIVCVIHEMHESGVATSYGGF